MAHPTRIAPLPLSLSLRPSHLALLVGLAAPVVAADFTTPEPYGWSRGATDGTYFQWESFGSAAGPNAPDAGMLPDPLPEGWPAPDVYDISGEAFISGAGNFYAFEGEIEIEARIPNPDFGAGYRTTVLVQIGTQGNELDYPSIAVNGAAPVETTELLRIPLGDDEPFGGDLVETLFVFELDGSAAEYVVSMPALVSNVSFDRLAIDTFTEPAPECPPDLDGSGVVDIGDLNLVLGNFGNATSNGDVDGNGIVDLADLNSVLGAFGQACPQ